MWWGKGQWSSLHCLSHSVSNISWKRFIYIFLSLSLIAEHLEGKNFILFVFEFVSLLRGILGNQSMAVE